ncbi:MAG TPA: hypothetical protein VMK65_06105 [Longimicrobiales bacterium]|nr:hypothetical protein [Longimicrobiales bacterium]
MTPRTALRLLALLLPVAACYPALELTPSDAERVLAHQLLDAPDPGVAGPFQVERLYYGSGTDRRRAVYRDSVTLETQSVDGGKLVDLGTSAKERNRYWGFTPKELPLNGRVWYPRGEGPFPLVLVVHGNHNMKDFSDPGYAYLGELLASRGMILVSVDENFLNGSIRNENDARAWVLLKHLEAWRGFAADTATPFHGKVDLERVALIGHSRGGEAVAHAAAFNRLTRYPDDGTLPFDFGFGIRAVVAIAPVDGQYRPADRLMPVEDVSYLTFHGSHDGDVTSFAGLRQYQRVTFTDSAARAPGVPPFKAAVYVYRANHGQWNTVWGAHDAGRRSPRVLDLRALLEPEEQRRFAEVYVGAFLEATLNGDARYLPLFRDHRVAGGWLPKTMYATRFEAPGFRPLATYEEDVELASGTLPGLRIEGDSLATWKEGLLQLRSANTPSEGSSQYNNAVWLGWNNRIAGEDTTRRGQPASYALLLPPAAEAALAGATALQLLLAPTDRTPSPRKVEPADSGGAEAQREPAAETSPEKKESAGDDDAPKPPVDLTIEVADDAGERARVALSAYGVARRPLEIRILRRPDLEKRRLGALHELVLQSYTIPLADFRAANPRLRTERLREVRFVFDRTVAGEVILDRVGLAALDPAFMRPAVPPVAEDGTR